MPFLSINSKSRGDFPIRILALDIRARRFGFVVLEGQTKLLDWGVRSLGGAGSSAKVGKRIASLLDMYQPTVTLAYARNRANTRRPSPENPTLALLRSAATERGVAIKTFERHEVRDFLESKGYRNKHEVARVIAERFHDLGWKLPATRKPWQTEDCRMTIFDAASLAVGFLESKEA